MGRSKEIRFITVYWCVISLCLKGVAKRNDFFVPLMKIPNILELQIFNISHVVVLTWYLTLSVLDIRWGQRREVSKGCFGCLGCGERRTASVLQLFTRFLFFIVVVVLEWISSLQFYKFLYFFAFFGLYQVKKSFI